MACATRDKRKWRRNNVLGTTPVGVSGNVRLPAPATESAAAPRSGTWPQLATRTPSSTALVQSLSARCPLTQTRHELEIPIFPYPMSDTLAHQASARQTRRTCTQVAEALFALPQQLVLTSPLRSPIAALLCSLAGVGQAHIHGFGLAALATDRHVEWPSIVAPAQQRVQQQLIR